MRILITGSRDFKDYATVARGITVAIDELRDLLKIDNEIVVIHGAARGADSLAEEFVNKSEQFFKARDIVIRSERHHADWKKHGRAAGPLRNQEMVDSGANICVAFFQEGAGNRGTTHCSLAAAEAGIRVLTFNSPRP
jgi:hypothetical protein